jgi:hypothetical protein
VSATIRVATAHRHRIQVIGTGEDRRYKIVCPDNGANCECWEECGEVHRCDCGPHPHDDSCDPGCEEDHALYCDEWLWDEHDLHGEEHKYVGGMVCVRGSGCWMPEWGIEFDRREDWPPGLYEFDYEDPDDDMGGLLYIVAMRAVAQECL